MPTRSVPFYWLQITTDLEKYEKRHSAKLGLTKSSQFLTLQLLIRSQCQLVKVKPPPLSYHLAVFSNHLHARRMWVRMPQQQNWPRVGHFFKLLFIIFIITVVIVVYRGPHHPPVILTSLNFVLYFRRKVKNKRRGLWGNRTLQELLLFHCTLAQN